jgi:hypothetical protein
MEPLERIFTTLIENQIRQGYSLRDATNTAYGQMTLSEVGQDNAIKHFDKMLNQLKGLKDAPDPEPEPEAVEEEIAEIEDADELPTEIEKPVTKSRK